MNISGKKQWFTFSFLFKKEVRQFALNLQSSTDRVGSFAENLRQKYAICLLMIKHKMPRIK